MKDGVLHGRGALDDKAMVAANLEVFLPLHRLHAPLTRDVIFLAEASEEASSAAGMATLVRTLLGQAELRVCAERRWCFVVD